MASQSPFYHSGATQPDCPYKHPDLPGTRHIRLLQLFGQGPQVANEDDILTCARWRHSVVDLDNLTYPYVAISYVWGGPPKLQNKASFEDGGFLVVTDSAAAILRYIIANKSNKYYWMDALCINQNDLEEKAYQVPLMYCVYSSAEDVTAWVGEESSDSGAALDFVEWLERQFEGLAQTEIPLTRNIMNNTSEQWKALARFLDRPFFRRIWIIQEMVAASNAMLICGERQLEWEKLALVIASLQRSGLEILISTFLGDQNGATVGAEALTVTCGMRDLVRIARTPTLEWNLMNCYTFDTTDPRDRVFALLNISSDAGDVALAPNYNKSVGDVFIDSAKYLLQKRSNSVSILYAAGIGTKRSLNGLPSWVPDWTTPPLGTIFGAIGDTAEILEKKGFKASGDDLNEPIVVCERSLKLKARICDVVDAFASPQPTWACRFNWLIELSQLLPSDKEYPAGGSFFPDVLSRALIADMTAAGEMADESTVDNFLNYFAAHYILAEHEGTHGEVPAFLTQEIESICDRMSTSSVVDTDGNPLSQERLGEVPHIPFDVFSQATVYGTALSSATSTTLGGGEQRSVFTTRDGYIGLCPPMTQKGDVLCLIHGTKVPFLIRHHSHDTYSLVGESYVHGIMFGEGIGKGPEVEITLV